MAIVYLLFLVMVGCSSSSDTQEVSASAKYVAAACGDATPVTFDFLEWGQQSANEYNCPAALSKMNCKLERATASSAQQATCETINLMDPEGVPKGCKGYSEGLHEYLLDGSLEAVQAYDCGEKTYFPGLRCFFFRDIVSQSKEEMICLDNDL